MLVGGRSRPERSKRAEVLPGVGKRSQASPGWRSLRLLGVHRGWEQQAVSTLHNPPAFPTCTLSLTRDRPPGPFFSTWDSFHLGHIFPPSTGRVASHPSRPGLNSALLCSAPCLLPQTGPTPTSTVVPHICHFALIGAELVMFMCQALPTALL